jgi:hypothetical protein
LVRCSCCCSFLKRGLNVPLGGLGGNAICFVLQFAYDS